MRQLLVVSAAGYLGEMIEVHIGVSLTLSIEGAGAYSLPLRRLLEKILTTLGYTLKGNSMTDGQSSKI